MVGYSTGNSGRFINAEYYERREDARTSAFTIDEFGPHEIEDYDLGEIQFGGGFVEREYWIRRPFRGEVEKAFDLRELPSR